MAANSDYSGSSVEQGATLPASGHPAERDQHATAWLDKAVDWDMAGRNITRRMCIEMQCGSLALTYVEAALRHMAATQTAASAPPNQLQHHGYPKVSAMLASGTGGFFDKERYPDFDEDRYPDAILVDWQSETSDPVAEMDAIYAEYSKTFGRYPDAEMAKTMERVRHMLVDWWSWHREAIRAALVKNLTAQAAPPVGSAAPGPTNKPELSPQAVPPEGLKEPT